MDKDGNNTLDYEEFRVFLDRLRVRPEIVSLFEKLAGRKGFLTPAEFGKFLTVVQKEKDLDPEKLIGELEKPVLFLFNPLKDQGSWKTCQRIVRQWFCKPYCQPQGKWGFSA